MYTNNGIENLDEHYKQTIDAFEENGFIVLSEALTKEQCKQLTGHMFELDRQDKLVKDAQCPLSGAIYGDPIFDDLLINLAEGVGLQVGKKLLPTYTYARLYRPGEELKRHKDRPSCEISATLTLGYDESTPVWPICFDEHKEIQVDLDVGELAVYKGCEVEHWRPKFKGKWQVQVFLHYVDANGPYKDHAMDGRKELGTQKMGEVFNQHDNKDSIIPLPVFDAIILPQSPEEQIFPGYVGMNQENFSDIIFSKEECQKIISFADNQYSGAARIGGGPKENLKREIRSADIYNIWPEPDWRWVHEKVCKAVAIANYQHFKYDVNTISHGLQLIHYRADEKIPGHYDWHVDAGPGPSATRKISFTVQLSDSNDYKGCDLLVADHGRELTAMRDQGSLSMFPSYMPHCVTPIESGERWALVIWVHGPKPFR